ncbi:helix-turn-helix domain-containing protein [Deinococcus sonorensis]|uniref:Helix-turn-helix domain-containing protein n=2 Tax=Deinococcus sonorensis TaxID=309891 RepID=A0AAU7U655_9DEIO
MAQPASSSIPVEHWATTPEQAHLLLRADLHPLLLRLMTAPQSASELALALGCTVQDAHYRLRALERAGIAQVVETRARAGRPIKRYRMRSDWFVPFELTSAETLLEFLEQQNQPRMNTFLRHLFGHLQAKRETLGFRLRREGEETSLVISTASGRDPLEDRPHLMQWTELRLTPDRAFQLMERLGELFEEYAQDDEETTFTLGLFLGEGALH